MKRHTPEQTIPSATEYDQEEASPTS